MFAVVKTGGKQYRVSKDDIVVVEKLNGQIGDAITLDNVLMVGEEGKDPKIGTPLIEGAHVTAELVEQARDDKITVIKFKRRKNYRRTQGHRQEQSVLKITGINA